MPRFKLEQTLFDPEIERTLRRLKKEKKKESNTYSRAKGVKRLCYALGQWSYIKHKEASHTSQ